MPVPLRGLSAMGIVAMLCVGGHILVVGLDELGWHWLYDAVHHAEEAVALIDGAPAHLMPAPDALPGLRPGVALAWPRLCPRQDSNLRPVV